MKHIYIGLQFFFLCSNGFAQAPLVKQWDFRFGGISTDKHSSFQQTSDGGFILGGYSRSGVSGDKSQPTQGINDYWIIKLDSIAVKQWDKSFGGTADDQLTSLIQTTDGGYLLGGSIFSDSSGDISEPNRDASLNTRDYWIVKTDAAGNKQWDKRYGGTNEDMLFSLQQTTDGGYILGGSSNSDTCADKSQRSRGTTDYWVIKINAAGARQWDKTIGGSNGDDLRSLQQTTDGGYILGGYSRSDSSGDKTTSSRGDVDFWIVKIDSVGVKQWEQRYGGNKEDFLYSIDQTSDGGYIMKGESNSAVGGDKTQPVWGTNIFTPDYWVVKADALGNKQWDKRFGGLLDDNGFGSVFQTRDGGYFMSGTSDSDSSGDKTENNLGFDQPWIIKTDALGNKLWDRTILADDQGKTEAYAIQAKDGCYVIATFTRANTGGDKTQDSWGSSYDYWILKFCDTTQVQCNLSASIIANQTLFCPSDSAQICAPSGFINYLWNTGETTSCINTQLAGNYYVTVTDNSGCTAVSNHLAISVYPLPPVSITVSGDTLRVYDAVTQQWYLNGSAISGAIKPTYIATQGGSYTVAVTDSNGCTAFSSPVLITGVDNITEDDVVSVYPNPSHSSWQLTVGNNLIGGVAEVFDAEGRLVSSSYILHSTSLIAPSVANGVYLLRISSTKSSVVRKLVKL